MLRFAFTVCFSIFLCALLTALMQAILKVRLEIRNRAAAIGTMEETAAEHASGSVPHPRKKTEKKPHFAAVRKMLNNLESELFDIGITLPVENFVLLWLLCAVGIPLLMVFFGIQGILAGAAAVAIAMIPILYVKLRRSQRRQKLDGQLVDAISMLCNAMRAGHSFQAALNTIASEMEAPISEEFGRVFRETLHGMSLDESLRRMVERVGSSELEMLTTAVTVQREVGGNMSEILANISGTIQARMALKTEIKTRTSSGRMSGYIVGALPVVLLIVMSAINPDYCEPLFQTDMGRAMLGAGVVMEVIGFIVIQKIITIKY